PNFNFAADVGTGAAGAINAATQAFTNALLGIGGSMIDGAAGLGKAGLTGAAGVGGALGSAAAGAASAAGKGASSLGGSLGGALDFGASGSGNAQLEATIAKYLAAAAAGKGFDASSMIEIAMRNPAIRAAIEAAVAAAMSGQLNGSGSLSLGPLGLVKAEAGVKKSVDGTMGGAAGIA
ncbi:hypothetical protein PMAYCL1PPCAC_00595, partial [Pristionchus mayeri]